MTDAFTILDWVLVGLTGALSVGGLFLGFGGQVGTIAGFGAASAAGYLLYGVSLELATVFGFSPESAGLPGAVIDVVFALLAFGLVRLLVKRFVSGCLGPLANTLLGALVGLLAGGALIGFLAGFGSSSGAEQNPFAEKSVIIRAVAGWGAGRAPSTPRDDESRP